MVQMDRTEQQVHLPKTEHCKQFISSADRFFPLRLCMSGISRGKLYVILGVCVATCGDGWHKSIKTVFCLSSSKQIPVLSILTGQLVPLILWNRTQPTELIMMGGLGSLHGCCAASAMWTTCTIGLTWLIMSKHDQNQRLLVKRV